MAFRLSDLSLDTVAELDCFVVEKVDFVVEQADIVDKPGTLAAVVVDTVAEQIYLQSHPLLWYVHLKAPHQLASSHY